MPIIKEQVNVEVEMTARRIAYAIEAQGITLKKKSGKYHGKKRIEFDDEEVNVRVTLKGQKHQTYSIKTTINSVSKTLAGSLKKDKINHVGEDYLLSDFNLSL